MGIDVTKDEELDEIYTLLYQNYVEDDDNMLRFDYSNRSEMGIDATRVLPRMACWRKANKQRQITSFDHRNSCACCRPRHPSEVDVRNQFFVRS